MRFIFTILLASLSSLLFAQDEIIDDPLMEDIRFEDQADGYFGLHVAVPMAGMKAATKNKMGDNGYGFTLQVLSNPHTWGSNKRNGPFRLGGELGYTYYGRFIQDVNINGFNGSYKTSHGMVTLNAVARVRPPVNERFVPFLDLFAGGDFYLSRIRENLSAIESGLGIQPLDLASSSSVSFTRGVAAGFSVAPKNKDGVRIYFRGSYNKGTSIKYIERYSMAYDPDKNAITYRMGKAPVSYWMFTVGVGI